MSVFTSNLRARCQRPSQPVVAFDRIDGVHECFVKLFDTEAQALGMLPLGRFVGEGAFDGFSERAFVVDQRHFDIVAQVSVPWRHPAAAEAPRTGRR